jgi:gluconate 5-dehydrogenase
MLSSELNQMFSLAGKTALITGSSRGLGLTIAQGLGKAGAKIILNGRNEETLIEAQTICLKNGLETDYKIFNINDENQVSYHVDQIEEEYGRIDILVNNAGIHKRKLLAEMTVEEWKSVLDVNLTGAFITARAVVKGMIRRKSGKIISICSLMSEVGRETTGNYAASKGGLKMLTKAMAVEWAKYNIQVNAIGPGYFLTELTKPLSMDPEFDGWLKKRTPAGRWGDPEELVGTAVFLASEASSFINGQVIYVDGGFLASV